MRLILLMMFFIPFSGIAQYTLNSKATWYNSADPKAITDSIKSEEVNYTLSFDDEDRLRKEHIIHFDSNGNLTDTAIRELNIHGKQTYYNFNGFETLRSYDSSQNLYSLITIRDGDTTEYIYLNRYKDDKLYTVQTISFGALSADATVYRHFFNRVYSRYRPNPKSPHYVKKQWVYSKGAVKKFKTKVEMPNASFKAKTIYKRDKQGRLVETREYFRGKLLKKIVQDYVGDRLVKRTTINYTKNFTVVARFDE
ncbi:hypothetical protein GYB22_03610 [bacterium]|nr:hypothetical protein [bacterium]